MFRPHYSICSQCNKQRLLVVSKLLCKQCNDERKGKSRNNNNKSRLTKRHNEVKKKPIHKLATSSVKVFRTNATVPKKAKKKKAPIQRRKTGSGEAEIFKKKWQEAIEKTDGKIICACCPSGLGGEPRAIFFSHVLPKGAYPRMRLDPRNIWLCCEKCHTEWDFGGRSQHKFHRKREFAEQLKTEYNQANIK